MVDENSNSGTRIRFIGALAGVGSGLAKVSVGHGFDTIKTRLQCSPGAYRGISDAFTQIVRKEGFSALYKGATPPAIGWAAIDSVLLGSLHNYRLWMKGYGFTEAVPGMDDVRLSLFGHSYAGLLAGVTSTVVATPIELLKVQLQLQTGRHSQDRQFKSPLDCARQIVRARGILGLYTGFSGSLIFRTNFFFMFGGFEAMMRTFALLEGTPYQLSTGFANFMSGGLGSYAFWIFAIPADNVKNRMMAAPLSAPTPSFAVTVRSIYSSGGLLAFSRGLGTSLLRAFPSNAMAFFVYEGILRNVGAEATRQ